MEKHKHNPLGSMLEKCVCEITLSFLELARFYALKAQIIEDKFLIKNDKSK